MADRSPLVPTPITDVNGKRTTVHRRPVSSAPTDRAPIPAPAAIKPSAASEPTAEITETYAERRARIAEDNRLWRDGVHPDFEAVRGEAMTALPDAIRATQGPGGHARTYAERIATAIERNEFAGILAAERLADLHWTLESSRHPFDVAAEPLPEKSVGKAGAPSRLWALNIATSLLALDLLPLAELVTLDSAQADPRMRAHLVASVRGWTQYNREDDEIVLLIDEYADDEAALRLIAAMREQERRDAMSIRAALSVARPLADGAL